MSYKMVNLCVVNQTLKFRDCQVSVIEERRKEFLAPSRLECR